MNLSIYKSSFRSMLLALIMGFGVAAMAQSGSPYKRFSTAANLVVADTLSGKGLNVQKVSPMAQHGSVTISLLGSNSNNIKTYRVAYLPQSGFIGIDTFTLEMTYNDGFPWLVYQAYAISTFPSILNAQSDFALTAVGVPIQIPVLANDAGSNPPLTVSSVPLSNNGTATINPDGTISFSPAAGYTGMAHLNYVVCDALGNCKTSAVDVSVTNANPTNDSLRIATAKNTGMSIPLNHNGYTVFQQPANGTVQILNGYVFRYEPQFNYTGIDLFVLENTSGSIPVYKTVMIDVLNTPVQNKMAIEDYIYTPRNTPITFNVRNNDIGNLLVKGTVVPTANFPGTVTGVQGNGQMTFTPNANFSGVVTFQYYIGNNNVSNLEIANVNILVGNLNPIQGTFNLTTPKETPLVINYQIPFLGYDFSILDQPDNGTVDFHYGYYSTVINGQTVSGYNLMIYTPYPGYVGNDEFDVNYCITQTGQCQTVKVAVNILDVTTAGPYCINDCVWAGDINNDGIVNNKDLLPLGYFMGLDGTIRPNASLEWYGQYAFNWNNPFTGMPIDVKHADTDGNGLVTTADTAAIVSFYGQTHNIVPNMPVAGKGLPFFLKLLTPNPGIGDLVQVEVSLGNNSLPVTNIYGFTYNALLSPKIVDSAFQMQYYDNSWLNLNSPSLALSKNPQPRKLETAFTRTNGVSASGYGKIGTFSFIVIDILDGSKPGDNPTLSIQMEGGQMLLADGTTLNYDGGTFEIPLNYRKNLEPTVQVSENDLLVYPTPASDLIQIHLNGNNEINQFSIFSVSGKEMWHSGNVAWKHAELSVDALPTGIYFAVAQTSAGKVTKKFQVIR